MTYAITETPQTFTITGPNVCGSLPPVVAMIPKFCEGVEIARIHAERLVKMLEGARVRLGLFPENERKLDRMIERAYEAWA